MKGCEAIRFEREHKRERRAAHGNYSAAGGIIRRRGEAAPTFRFARNEIRAPRPADYGGVCGKRARSALSLQQRR